MKVDCIEKADVNLSNLVNADWCRDSLAHPWMTRFAVRLIFAVVQRVLARGLGFNPKSNPVRS
jgi:hypothetical protein